MSTAAHILVLNIAATGHVLPTLDLVGELVRRGYRVDYLTTKDYADDVMSTGATPVDYDSTLVAQVAETPPPEDFAAWLPFVLLAETHHVLPQLLDRFSDDPPAVLIFDRTTYLTARVLADRWRVPTVELFPSFAYNETFNLALATNQQTLLDPEHEAYQTFAHQLSELTEAYGTSTISVDDFTIGRTAEALVAVPREFQIEGDSFDAGFHFIGPGLKRRLPTGGTTGTKNPDHPTLYVSLGTAFTNRAEVFRTAIDAFGGTSWRLELSIGSLDVQLLGELPNNVTIHSYVDQLQLLATASAFVTHAGMGSIMESMRMGVPVVCVPQTTEQATVAARVAELGLGLVLTNESSPQDLADAVRQVTTDRHIRTRVRAMQSLVVNSPGASHGADLIENVLGTVDNFMPNPS